MLNDEMNTGFLLLDREAILARPSYQVDVARSRLTLQTQESESHKFVS